MSQSRFLLGASGVLLVLTYFLVGTDEQSGVLQRVSEVAEADIQREAEDSRPEPAAVDEPSGTGGFADYGIGEFDYEPESPDPLLSGNFEAASPSIERAADPVSTNAAARAAGTRGRSQGPQETGERAVESASKALADDLRRAM